MAQILFYGLKFSAGAGGAQGFFDRVFCPLKTLKDAKRSHAKAQRGGAATKRCRAKGAKEAKDKKGEFSFATFAGFARHTYPRRTRRSWEIALHAKGMWGWKRGGAVQNLAESWRRVAVAEPASWCLEALQYFRECSKRCTCRKPWSRRGRSSWYGRIGRGADPSARRCARRSSRAGPGGGWPGAARCDRSRRTPARC